MNSMVVIHIYYCYYDYDFIINVFIVANVGVWFHLFGQCEK